MRKWLCALLAALFCFAAARAESGGEFLYEITEDGAARVVKYTDDLALELDIPAEIDGLTVTALGRDALADCAFMTRVTLPDSLREVESGAFRGCFALMDIVISPGHPTLRTEDGVLFSREDGRLICFPADLGRAGFFPVLASFSRIFPFASEVREYGIPDGTPAIASWAFAQSRLSALYIPDSVVSIGEEAFLDCEKLEAAYLPEGLESIGPRAFAGCAAMTEAVVPASVTEIGEDAFEGCDRLTVFADAGSFAETYCLARGIPCARAE